MCYKKLLFGSAGLSLYRYHVFVCTGPTCTQDGAEETIQVLQQKFMEHGLERRGVKLTLCRCLGQCGNGPNMVIYPEGTWYAHVDEEGAAEIVEEHLIGQQPVSRLIHEPVELI
jgi:NADH-quinone oxidoreductase subunit F/NADP-reducing hydrogenase subunit HndC